MNYRKTIFFNSSEIVILIEAAKENSEVNLSISYVVYNASWTPKYDIRVFNKDKSMVVIIPTLKSQLKL
jgi:hypothetical protein